MAQGMTLYVIHYKNGKTHRIMFHGDTVSPYYWTALRRQARDQSGNHSGVDHIVRESTGETVWTTAYKPKPH